MAFPTFEYIDNEDGTKTVKLDGMVITDLVSNLYIEADHKTSEVTLELVASIQMRHTTFFGKPYVNIGGERYRLVKE